MKIIDLRNCKCTKRSGVFETNSSSVHSIVYAREELEPSKLPVRSGYTMAKFGTFGKDYARYFSQADKLSYLASLIWYSTCSYSNGLSHMYESYEWRQLEDAVCPYNGTNGIRMFKRPSRPEIDHQSISDYGITFINMWDTNKVRQFIFNPDIGLQTECD